MPEAHGDALFIRLRKAKRSWAPPPKKISAKPVNNEGEYLEAVNDMKEQFEEIDRAHKKKVRCMVNCIEDLQHAYFADQSKKVLGEMVTKAAQILHQLGIRNRPSETELGVRAGMDVLAHMRRTRQWSSSLVEWLLKHVFYVESMKTDMFFRFCTRVRKEIWNVMRDDVLEQGRTAIYRPAEQRDDDAPEDPLFFDSREAFMNDM